MQTPPLWYAQIACWSSALRSARPRHVRSWRKLTYRPPLSSIYRLGEDQSGVWEPFTNDCGFEPVSAKTQPVSVASTPKFRILKIRRAETRPGNPGLRYEVHDIPRQRPGSWPPTSGQVDTSPIAGNPCAESTMAGWGARIRTWKWRNQSP